jgi:hypothetical protein
VFGGLKQEVQEGNRENSSDSLDALAKANRFVGLCEYTHIPMALI